MQKSRSSHMSNRHLTEARGSALPSALLFLFLVSAFLTSLSQRVKYQLVGHQLIQDSYRAQTMALVTEQEIQLDYQSGRPLSMGTYMFNAGDVLVEEKEPDALQITVILPNGFTHSHTVLLPAAVTDEEAAETTHIQLSEQAREGEAEDDKQEDKNREGKEEGKEEGNSHVLPVGELDATESLSEEE